MESVKIGNSTVNYYVETVGGCETDIGEEILRDTKIKALCLVAGIELAEGDSAVSVIQGYCNLCKDYPIVMIATSNGRSSKEALVIKMRNQLIYNSLGFHELSACYDDGDTQYYIANNKASMDVYEILQVKIFLIQFGEIMSDDKQTDRLIDMMSGEIFSGLMTPNIKRWVELWDFNDDETLRSIDSFPKAN